MAAATDQIRYWYDSMGSVPVLAKDEVIRLGSLIQNPETSQLKRKKAIDKLVVHNMRLIPKVVKGVIAGKRSIKFGDTFTEDLLQIAVIGLYSAAAKFDPAKGYAFSTYATNWIYSAVNREVNCNYTLIRVPENTVHDFYKAVKDKRDLSFANEKPKVRERLTNAFFALNCKFFDDLSSNFVDELDFHSVIADKVNTTVIDEDFEGLLALGKLTEKQAKVFRMIYESSMTQAQVSRQTGMSRDVVRRLHNIGLRKLKKAIAR